MTELVELSKNWEAGYTKGLEEGIQQGKIEGIREFMHWIYQNKWEYNAKTGYWEKTLFDGEITEIKTTNELIARWLNIKELL